MSADQILKQRKRMPASWCNCCAGPAEGYRFCEGCRAQHGSEMPARNQETWEPLCLYFRASSAAYAARIAALPAYKVLAELHRHALDGYEPIRHLMSQPKDPQ